MSTHCPDAIRLCSCWHLLAAFVLLAAPWGALAQEVELDSSLREPPDVQPLASFLNEDPHKAPEVSLAGPFRSGSVAPDRLIENIKKLNRADPDGFMKTLSAARPDLRGLPFAMGKDCRMQEKQAQLFSRSAVLIKGELRDVAFPGSKDYELIATRQFWQNFDKELALLDKGQAPGGADLELAATAGLVQILVPSASGRHREFMARRLARHQRIETTQALARLALFAPEDAVRAEAIQGLQGRPARDYKELLIQGFRYPLPVVSSRAAKALVKLQRRDALADLIGVLERADPRAPVQQTIDGKQVAVVRELVRVNHHRNCLLCHAPAHGAPADVLTARVPLSDVAFSTNLNRYYHSGGVSADFAIRIDMTYLRQDFSMMMRVAKAAPWPEMQRFDFLVRSRVLSAEEAAAYDKLIAAQKTPPSHAAAQLALRELTGQDPEDARPQTWRKLLNLP